MSIFSNIKSADWWKKNWRIFTLLSAIVMMFYFYCYLSISSGHTFNTPDENANFFFVNNWHQNQSLRVYEPLNAIANNIVFPRSINIVENDYVPMSFLGLPLFYGLISMIIGINLVSFITPILSLLSVLLFFGIIKAVFDEKIAFFSSLLLLFQPIFWYTAAKSMLHNNLAIFFFLVSLYCLIKIIENQHKFFLYLSIIATCFSIWTRTSEIVWLGFWLIVFYFYFRKEIPWQRLVSIIAVAIMLMSLLLVFNYQTYDNIFSVGYSRMNTEGQAQVNPILNVIRSLFMPFGFNLKNIIFNVYNIFIKYLWLWTIPAIFGWFYMLKKTKNETQKFYFYSTSFTALFLIFYYGSFWPWGLSGQPETPNISIGEPHLRYWLPIFILFIPFIVVFIKENFNLSIRLFNKSIKLNFVLIYFLVTSLFAVNFAIFDQAEGLEKIRTDLSEFQPRIEAVKKLVPNNAVLIVPHWADRIFFPTFNVIQSIEDREVHFDDVYKNIKTLTAIVPVYYYSASSSEDIETVNTTFNEVNLKLTKISDIYKGEKLYAIEPVK